MDTTSEQSAAPENTNQTSTVAEKSWEHAWSVDEMRKSSSRWSLAADVGLLEHMKEFASRLTAQAHNVSCEVSQLLYDTQLTDAKIQSVTDYFLTLSDSQFIENRVYDEDDSVAKEEEKKEEDEKPKTREQREAEMIPRLKEAVAFGLDVINDAYDVLDVQVVDSDSEDDEEAIPLPANEVILEPKDPYVTRPLPHLIGSRGFHEEDDVGVGDLLSDDAESEVGSMSESEEEVEKAPSVSDVSSSDYDSDDESVSDDSDLEDHPVARKKTRSLSSSTDMSSSDDEGLFVNRNQDSSEDEPLETQPKKRTTPKKRAASKRSQPEEDLFAQEEPEDDIFAGSSGLFGKGGGLFGETKGGLFDGVEAFDEGDDGDDESGPEEEEAKPERVVAKKPQPKNVPHGGVSLFGGAIKKGFFQGQDDSDQSEESDEAPPEAKPPKETSSSNMFAGESSDEDDLFKEKPKPANKAEPMPPPAKSGGLFDEDSEDEGDDLFEGAEKEEPVPEEVAPPTKRPVGGVSMFGSGGNALQEAIRRRASSSTTDNEDEDDGLFSRKPPKGSFSSASSASTEKTKSLNEPKSKDKAQPSPLAGDKEQKASKATKAPPPKAIGAHKPSKAAAKISMFDDESDSEDDLFSGMTKSKPIPAPTKPKPIKKEKSSVESDDLFASTPEDRKKAKKPATEAKPAPTKKPKQTKGLFGSDSEDDLFASKPPAAEAASGKKTPPDSNDLPEQEAPAEEEVATQKVEQPIKKKLAGAVSMFGVGGGELLAAISKQRSSSQKSATSIRSDEATSSSKPVEKKPEKSEKDEDDGLFGTKLPSSSISAPTTNVTPKPFSLASSSTRTPTLSKVTAPTAKHVGDGIDKLQARLSINPSALLPGATPTIVSTVDVTAPLESATKTRSRGQAGRRPPSRQARRKIAEAATNDLIPASPTTNPSPVESKPSSTVASTATPQPNGKISKAAPKDDFLDDVLASSGPKKEPKPEAVAKKSKMAGLFDDIDDLFEPSKDSKKLSSKAKADDLFTLNDEDDLFDAKSKSSTKKKPPATDDLFSTDAGFEPGDSLFDSAETKKKSSSKKHNLFSDDLFADVDDGKPTAKKNIKPSKPALDDDEDIFGSPSDLPTSKPTKMTKPEKEDPVQVDDDDLFDDLTSPSNSKKKNSAKDKAPKTKVDDLFADDADIFGDLPPAKPKTKKTTKKSSKTKSAPVTSLFDDDDIFSSSTPPKTSETKAKKKKTKKQTENPAPSSKSNPDIFDDPLSALLSP